MYKQIIFFLPVLIEYVPFPIIFGKNLEAERNPYCGTESQCDVAQQNVLCEFYPCDVSDSCKDSVIANASDEFRTLIAKHINNYRDLVAGGDGGKGQTVADMNEMTYSLEMEFFSNCAINRCQEEKFVPYCAKPISKEKLAGLIIFSLTTSVETSEDSIVYQMLDQAKMEYENWYKAASSLVIPAKIGNLWYGQAEYVGCARRWWNVTTISKTLIVYCHIYPEFRTDKALYHGGPICSGCNTVCSKTHTSLCLTKPPDPFNPPFTIPLQKQEIVSTTSDDISISTSPCTSPAYADNRKEANEKKGARGHEGPIVIYPYNPYKPKNSTRFPKKGTRSLRKSAGVTSLDTLDEDYVEPLSCPNQANSHIFLQINCHLLILILILNIVIASHVT